MRAILLAALATAAAACVVPAQRGTQTTYPGNTTTDGGGTASIGGVGQTTQAVATPTGIAITASSAELVPVARREPMTYGLNHNSLYLIDPITHTCALVYAGHITVPVDCAALRTGLPQVAYLIDWLPAPTAAPAAP